MDRKELEAIARSGGWDKVDTSELTTEMVNQTTWGMSLLHIAADGENLNKFPKHLITPEGLLIENGTGETVLHMAANCGEIHIIPKELLTEENITKPDLNHNTPLHYLALRGDLKYLPKSLYTEKNFSIKDDKGRTPLDFAILGLISCEEATSKTVSEEKDLKNCIRIILSTLSLKTLNELVKRNEDIIHHERAKEFIQEEITRKKVMKAINKDEMTIEI